MKYKLFEQKSRIMQSGELCKMKHNASQLKNAEIFIV